MIVKSILSILCLLSLNISVAQKSYPELYFEVGSEKNCITCASWDIPLPIEIQKELAKHFGIVGFTPNNNLSTFVFDSLSLNWNERTQSYLSKTENQSLDFCGYTLNYRPNISIEIIDDTAIKKSISIKIYAVDGDWFVFQFSGNIISSLSSNPNYNNTVSKLKKKSAKYKAPNGNSIEFIIGNNPRGCTMQNVSEF